MRYVDLDGFVVPPEWLNEAQAALKEVSALPANERRDAISKRSPVWQALKNRLADYMHGKCWYCESVQLRSDNCVDHYRPKGKVHDCPDHGGYWWLAFDWHNFRYSCTYCNSLRHDAEDGPTGGKGDSFPLVDETTRARCPGDDLAVEEPYLLDPVSAWDVSLLWFDPTGRAVPRYPEDRFPKRFYRAQVSIELYHLKEYRLVAKRQVLYNDVARLVRRGRRAWATLVHDPGDRQAEAEMDDVLRSLSRMLDKYAEYSAAARAHLHGLVDKPDRDWVGELLQ